MVSFGDLRFNQIPPANIFPEKKVYLLGWISPTNTELTFTQMVISGNYINIHILEKHNKKLKTLKQIERHDINNGQKACMQD